MLNFSYGLLNLNDHSQSFTIKIKLILSLLDNILIEDSSPSTLPLKLKIPMIALIIKYLLVFIFGLNVSNVLKSISSD